jgi:hypothetical protein
MTTQQDAFVSRVRRHRERQGVALADVARQTRIKLEWLEALEQADLSAWPKGLYARAWIRAYATAIGLDADDTVEEFCRLFPHGDRRLDATIVELGAIVDVPVHLPLDDESVPFGRRWTDTPRAEPSASLGERLHRTLEAVRDIRHPEHLRSRLAESWRGFRPSRRPSST